MTSVSLETSRADAIGGPNMGFQRRGRPRDEVALAELISVELEIMENKSNVLRRGNSLITA